MKFVTQKEQDKIDALNIKKIEFAMKVTYQECLPDAILRDFHIQAQNIYYADDVIL